MKKRRRKVFRRMDKMLFLMMKAARKDNPVNACAACCATLSILYKTLDEEGRETLAPIITRCLAMITEDGKQAGKRVH